MIDFLKGKEPNAGAGAALISSKRILTTGIIMAELPQGTRNAREEAYVTELIEAIPAIEITAAIWSKAGKLSCSLRRKGITLPLSDVAIATAAIEYNISIFTIDDHFKQIPGVRIHEI